MENKLSLDMILASFDEAIDELDETPVFGSALEAEEISMTSSLLSDMEAIVSSDSKLSELKNRPERTRIQKELSDSDKHMIDKFVTDIVKKRGVETLKAIAKSPVSLNILRRKLVDVLYRKTEHSLEVEEKNYLELVWTYLIMEVREVAFADKHGVIRAIERAAS